MRKFVSTVLSLYLAFTLFAQDSGDGVTDMGGGYEENLFGAEEDIIDLPEEEDEIVESWRNISFENDGVYDINDSLRAIPAYDMYCKWDTRNIHAYEYDLTKKHDTTRLILQHAHCDYQLPCGGHVTSDFGERGARYHYGIDLKLHKGDPVKTAFEGVVRISQYSRSYGHVIVVRHNNGLETLYAHLSKRQVKPGDHVEAGEVIGLGGNTGRSSGAHLHFECRFMGEPINPNEVIDFETGRLKSSFLDISADNFDYLKKARAKKYHRVRSGDTLYGIARRYRTSVNTLCRLNGIRESSILRIGQSLRYR